MFQMRLTVVALMFATPALAQETSLISLTENSDLSSTAFPRRAAASDDGRHIVWGDSGTDLVASPVCSNIQIYARDRDPDGNGVFDEGNGTTTLLSIGIDGQCANANCGYWSLDMSNDGRFVIWESSADNLVADDQTGPFHLDLFVRDRDPDGDGVFDEGNGVTTRLLAPNGEEVDWGVLAQQIGISKDGRYVTFASQATNLVDGVGGSQHVFRWDRNTDEIIAASAAMGFGGAALQPHISANGRWIVFISTDETLVPDDTNGVIDVFVYDMAEETFARVSVNDAGVEGNDHSGSINNTRGPRISNDGRFVVFYSNATNLDSQMADTNGHPDIFLHDRDPDGDGSFDEPGEVATRRISSGPGGVESDNVSRYPDISDNGYRVVFESAGTLVPDDPNTVTDVYVYEIPSGETRLYSRASDGTPANSVSVAPVISGDGTQIVFLSPATNLVPNDTNGRPDVFARSAPIIGPAVCDAEEADRIENPTPAQGDRFGWQLDTDGTRFACLSAPDEVSVYLADGGGGWTLEQVITDDGADSLFGARIQIDGDIMAITDLLADDSPPPGADAVHIYERIEGIWTRTVTLQNPNPNLINPEDDAFGLDLALDAPLLMIGAYQEDLDDGEGGVIDGAGAVYVYQRINQTLWRHDYRIPSPNPQDIGFFGWECEWMLAQSQESFPIMLINANNEDAPLEASGAVHVFLRLDSNTYEYESTMTAPNPVQFGRFGHSISADGELVAIGIPGDFEFGRNSGAVQVMRRNPLGTWASEGVYWPAKHETNPESIFDEDAFGGDLSLSGETFVGAASGLDINQNGGGLIIFDRQPDMTWTERRTLIHSEPQFAKIAGDTPAYLSQCVLAGQQVLSPVVGHDDDLIVDSGAIYVWNLDDLVTNDCNNNGVDDGCDIVNGTSQDVDGDGVPDECGCPADLSGDGSVDVGDILIILANWGGSGDGDVNGDGIVDVQDLLDTVGSWGPC